VQGSVSPTYVAVSVSTFIPTTATIIKVQAISGSSGLTMAAPSSSYGTYTSSNPPPINTGNTSAGICGHALGDFALESSNIYIISSSSGGVVNIVGWEDNI